MLFLRDRAARAWPSACIFSCALLVGISATATALQSTPAAAQGAGPQSVAPIAQRLLSAVVNISTAQKVENRSRGALPRVPEGSPFEDLFEDFFQNEDGNSARKVNSLGSGFIIDGQEGLIVTNNHVIEGADEITIILKDGRKLRVDKVLGTDSQTDLALLKVTPKSPLPDVKFGSSEEIQIGDWVLAIGNPFGLGGSVSVGIISAKEGDIRTGPYDDYLQTDAAINKGNSGGPLFNMSGDVIGVNTAIISPTGGSIGIGFAVPSDTAMVVIDQLRRFGETRRGWLGVNIQTVTDDLAESLGVPANKGAYVSSVADDGPAKAAGIAPGDIIVSFDGRPIEKMRVLPRIVAQTEEGKTVQVVLLRKGETLTRELTVGRLKQEKKQETASADPATRGGGATDGDRSDAAPVDGPVLGLSVTPVNDDLIKKHSLKPGTKGVVVTAVETGSDAERKQLNVGDVIAEASGTAVTSAAILAQQVERARGANKRSILLRVVRADGTFRFVALAVR